MDSAPRITPDGHGLTLVLTKGSGSQSATITAHFRDVARLDLQQFGGGLTQLLYLAVEDVSVQQWDRVRYRVFDAERDMISFLRRDVTVSYH